MTLPRARAVLSPSPSLPSATEQLLEKRLELDNWPTDSCPKTAFSRRWRGKKGGRLARDKVVGQGPVRTHFLCHTTSEDCRGDRFGRWLSEVDAEPDISDRWRDQNSVLAIHCNRRPLPIYTGVTSVSPFTCYERKWALGCACILEVLTEPGASIYGVYLEWLWCGFALAEMGNVRENI